MYVYKKAVGFLHCLFFRAYRWVTCNRVLQCVLQKGGVWGVKKLSDKALKALHGKPQDRQKS